MFSVTETLLHWDSVTVSEVSGCMCMQESGLVSSVWSIIEYIMWSNSDWNHLVQPSLPAPLDLRVCSATLFPFFLLLLLPAHFSPLHPCHSLPSLCLLFSATLSHSGQAAQLARLHCSRQKRAPSSPSRQNQTNVGSRQDAASSSTGRRTP